MECWGEGGERTGRRMRRRPERDACRHRVDNRGLCTDICCCCQATLLVVAHQKVQAPGG